MVQWISLTMCVFAQWLYLLRFHHHLLLWQAVTYSRAHRELSIIKSILTFTSSLDLSRQSFAGQAGKKHYSLVLKWSSEEKEISMKTLDCLYNHMYQLYEDIYCMCPWVCLHIVHPCESAITIFRLWAVVQTMLIGCKDDEVTLLIGGSRLNATTLPVFALFVCAAVVVKRMLSSVSSSSCSASDPHTHCSSTDLYTPNYTLEPHDSTETPHT